MGVRQSKAGTTGQAMKPGSDCKAVKNGTTAAFRAIDARNVCKLLKALAVGAAVGTVHIRQSSSNSIMQSRPMSLLEYAVEKNFLPGVKIILKVRFYLSFHTADCAE